MSYLLRSSVPPPPPLQLARHNFDCTNSHPHDHRNTYMQLLAMGTTFHWLSWVMAGKRTTLSKDRLSSCSGAAAPTGLLPPPLGTGVPRTPVPLVQREYHLPNRATPRAAAKTQNAAAPTGEPALPAPLPRRIAMRLKRGKAIRWRSQTQGEPESGKPRPTRLLQRQAHEPGACGGRTTGRCHAYL
jgi:hypothetical protein